MSTRPITHSTTTPPPTPQNSLQTLLGKWLQGPCRQICWQDLSKSCQESGEAANRIDECRKQWIACMKQCLGEERIRPFT